MPIHSHLLFETLLMWPWQRKMATHSGLLASLLLLRWCFWQLDNGLSVALRELDAGLPFDDRFYLGFGTQPWARCAFREHPIYPIWLMPIAASICKTSVTQRRVRLPLRGGGFRRGQGNCSLQRFDILWDQVDCSLHSLRRRQQRDDGLLRVLDGLQCSQAQVELFSTLRPFDHLWSPQLGVWSVELDLQCLRQKLWRDDRSWGLNMQNISRIALAAVTVSQA